MDLANGLQVSVHDFGGFRLDGGSMFGSVPKALWQRNIAPDEENRIPLATRSLVVRAGDRTFVVDLGMGDKWTGKAKEIFAAYQYLPPPFPMTDIILTHLHFDHAGGISKREGDRIVPRFPDAKYTLQRGNLLTAETPNAKERASYLPENVGALSALDVTYIEGNAEIHPDIHVHRVDGHTLGQQYVEVRGGAETILFPTDLIPTSHHLTLPFTMGYDMCASTLLEEKAQFLDYALTKDAIVVFQHDPLIQAARLKVDVKGYAAVREVIGLA